jgi:DNA-directed RNA polymerase subunit omega
MARITVEDCIDKIGNRFALVLATAKRTKQLMAGSKFLDKPVDNKHVVKALREIASGKVRPDRDISQIVTTRLDPTKE